MVAEGRPIIAMDRSRMQEVCRRHRIRTLRFFGSVLRPDFAPESDIDVLVEFEPGVDPDLLELGGIQQDLSDVLGREVDLNTHEMFSPPRLQRVLRSSVVGYAAQAPARPRRSRPR